MRNKVLLLDTLFAKENALVQGVNSTMRYLVDNRDVPLSEMDTNTLYQTRLLSKTPTTRIFEHLMSDGLLEEYTLIDTSINKSSVPELLTINDITVDMKQMSNASMVFASMKEYRNKVIINVAPLIKRSREGFVQASDVNALHSLIVRGALVSSYYNNSDSIWLNPNLCKFIAQTYSMCISTVLQRIYNLSVPEQLTIAGALTWFIMNRMTDDCDELTIQCDWLGSRMNNRQMVEMFKDTVDDMTQFDLYKLCNLISVCGPDHMKSFNKDIFTRTMTRSGSSFISMHMALEYPPYWVHQLLYALSGNKVHLADMLQKTKLLKSAGQFLQDLDSCRQFVPSVGYITKGHECYRSEDYSISECGYKKRSLSRSIPTVVLDASNYDHEVTNAQIIAFNNLMTKVTNETLNTPNTENYKRQLSKYGFSTDKNSKLTSVRIGQDGTIYLEYTVSHKEGIYQLGVIRSDNLNKMFVETNIKNSSNFIDIFGRLSIDDRELLEYKMLKEENEEQIELIESNVNNDAVQNKDSNEINIDSVFNTTQEIMMPEENDLQQNNTQEETESTESLFLELENIYQSGNEGFIDKTKEIFMRIWNFIVRICKQIFSFFTSSKDRVLKKAEKIKEKLSVVKGTEDLTENELFEDDREYRDNILHRYKFSNDNLKKWETKIKTCSHPLERSLFLMLAISRSCRGVDRYIHSLIFDIGITLKQVAHSQVHKDYGGDGFGRIDQIDQDDIPDYLSDMSEVNKKLEKLNEELKNTSESKRMKKLMDAIYTLGNPHRLIGIVDTLTSHNKDTSLSAKFDEMVKNYSDNSIDLKYIFTHLDQWINDVCDFESHIYTYIEALIKAQEQITSVVNSFHQFEIRFNNELLLKIRELDTVIKQLQKNMTTLTPLLDSGLDNVWGLLNMYEDLKKQRS